MKKIIPPVLFLLCLIVMALLRWFWPIGVLFRYPVNLVGLLPIIVGLFAGGAGAFRFVRERTNIHPFREADKLVTAGVFRWTRNPMYLGLSLVLGGVWMLLGVLTPLAGPLIFIAVCDCWYIRQEERMMRAKFGAAYEDYCQRVRRWV